MNHPLCLCELIKAAAAVCERTLNDALTGHDISHCQAQVLLKVRDKQLSMVELSRILCCHKSNVTQVVDGLVKKGLMAREGSTTDKRVCLMVLTEKGRGLCDAISSVLGSKAADCMGIFSDEEREELRRMLEKVVGTKQQA